MIMGGDDVFIGSEWVSDDDEEGAAIPVLVEGALTAGTGMPKPIFPFSISKTLYTFRRKTSPTSQAPSRTTL